VTGVQTCALPIWRKRFGQVVRIKKRKCHDALPTRIDSPKARMLSECVV
jgi:hypothetical protein